MSRRSIRKRRHRKPVLVQGQRYAFSSVVITIDGHEIKGLTSINYERSRRA